MGRLAPRAPSLSPSHDGDGAEHEISIRHDDGSRRASCTSLMPLARALGLHRVEVVAWRDLDDPEAGGSELHSHRIGAQWAAAGMDVTFRTSAVRGQPVVIERCGYQAVRRHGRYMVFPAVAYEGLRSRRAPDALVEVWNGMPFFSPLWFRGPRLVFLHHVHAEMWRMVLPPSLAAMGRRIESTLAPQLYRRSSIVTLSESSRQEIISMLRLPPARVNVVHPGVDASFTPGGPRAPYPLVVAVGRLVPVKRFDLLIEALARTRQEHPTLRAVIVGEGYERERLETLRRDLQAEDWLALSGHVGAAELTDLYRKAWIVASTSLREGWGMTLTEAGACATPGVATSIAGHRDAVLDGTTGLLADGVDGLATAMSRLLADEGLRRRMGEAAQERARSFSWDGTASATLRALIREVARRGAKVQRPVRAFVP